MIRTHEPHEDFLTHYGTLRRSGRYPWGSGDPESTRNRDFLDMADSLKKKGMSDTEIAKGMNMTRLEFTTKRSDARDQDRREKQIYAQRLQEKGMSKSAIGRQMGLNESSVRLLLAPGAADKANARQTTINMLKGQVDEKSMVDVGVGVEHHVGVTRTRLDQAVQSLKNNGYGVYNIFIAQVNAAGQFTPMRVLAKPGISKQDVERNRAQIRQITEHSTDQGRSYLDHSQPPISVANRRIAINYGPDGGKDLDGLIYVRPGVKDLAIGNKNYGQVRIMVANTHYLKGMAVYKDDLPEGVDIMFNTKKLDTGRKLDAMKPIKDDPDFPFGAIVNQVLDPKTGKVTSAMNLVNEEGSWDKWSKTLSSQMLSKQDPKLAKQQLNVTYENRLRELKEIQALTNPTVKRELLIKFSDSTDAAAVHLKAANLPRQATKVLLPMNSIKRDQVYAPTFNHGERVVLVRHPHGGPFEIPELTVNNRNPEARRIMGTSARDAIGIHHSVAHKLSGADFDGDTVLVIPNPSQNKNRVKSDPSLEGLKDFDPMIYAIPKGSSVKVMTSVTKQNEMGKISNLITDMTILGANNVEKAAALRHSMVVIDAENHKLDYKASEKDNNIKNLKAKYQLGPNAGARTLISQAGAAEYIPMRRERPARYGGPIDPATGKRMYEQTGKSYPTTKKVKDPDTGKTTRVPTGGNTPRMMKVKRLSVTDNAFDLTSDKSTGTEMEAIYATHSNQLKAMANGARKEAMTIKDLPRSKSAPKVYANEVASLNSKLNVALANAPLERQAQLLTNAVVSQKRQANPDIEKEELKKIKQATLTTMRNRTGAGKERIPITQREWDAIQAQAISPTQLKKILQNAEVDEIKALAMPKNAPKMTSAKMARAKQMDRPGLYSIRDSGTVGCWSYYTQGSTTWRRLIMDDDTTTEPTEYMLTTVDNPFDPFTRFDEWYRYDIRMGYNTSAFLARIVRTSNDISEADQQLAIQDAIDEIVKENVSGVWRKVSRNSVHTM